MIRQTFSTGVHPPGRSLAHNAGGKGDLSEIVNAAAISCWTFDQHSLMISSVSGMYPMAVVDSLHAQDSFCVVQRFWQPCHISKIYCLLESRSSFFSSVPCFDSESFSLPVVPNCVQWPANMLVLAQVNILTMNFSGCVLSVVLDCPQPLTSR